MEPMIDPKQPPEAANKGKRGWVLDALVKVGQLEAAMSHNDEQICFLKEQLVSGDISEDDVFKISNEIATNEEICKVDYQNRVESLNYIFDQFNGDRHYYCQLKHRATAFVIACENAHANGWQLADEESVFQCAQSLALTCSLAFGFEPMSCLRCLDEALKTYGFEESKDANN